MSFPHLLSPGRIGPLELRNRICLTPMGTNLESSDGTPGEDITRFYEERAAGGVGLVIVGVVGVAWPAGVSNPRNMGLSRDDFVPAFRELTGRVHARGAAIAAQLQHAGRTSLQDVAAGRPLWVPSRIRESAGDLFDALAPEEIAAVTAPYTGPESRLDVHEMTAEDVTTLCGWFADAAERARAAGFDGAEIHASHGYLLASFLSPSTNRREDAYGGPLENRARVLLEVIRAVRARVGDDFPLWCRLDGAEYRKADGITEEDARRTAELAVAAGLDAVHVSAYADPRRAIAFTEAPLPHAPGAYEHLAAGVKARVDVPVIAVGRLDPVRAERALAAGCADFVAMGRALLADPALPAKLARGEAPRPCVYAYRCVGNVFLNRSVRCVANPDAGREAQLAPKPATSVRRVLVAGGGPAGLEAARRLAERGHRVTLCEREPRLGGLGLAAAIAEPANAALVAHLEDAVRRAGVGVRTACAVTPELVHSLDPDAVVVAVGARRARPDVPGADGPNVVDPWDLREGLGPVLARGPRAVVVGGDLVGVEIAERLAAEGAQVTLVAEDAILARRMAPPRRWRAHHALADAGVDRHTGAALVAVEPDAVRFTDADGAPQRVPADVVVLARSLAPDPSLASALAGGRAAVHAIGDCVEPRTFEEALLEAARTAGAI